MLMLKHGFGFCHTIFLSMEKNTVGWLVLIWYERSTTAGNQQNKVDRILNLFFIYYFRFLHDNQ